MYRDLTKRIMALALSVCMIAGMVDLSGLTVRAAETKIQNATVEVDRSNPIVYDGSPKEPAVTVTDINDNVISADEYTVKYENHINQGTARVTVVNKKDPTDTNYETFTIAQRDIELCGEGGFPTAASLAQEVPGSDAPINPTVKVTDSGNKDHQELIRDRDYTYSVRVDRAPTADAPGEATLMISGINNYTGSKEITFAITLLDGKKLVYTLTDGSFDYADGDRTSYTGAALELETKDGATYEGNKIDKSLCEVHYGSNRAYAGEVEAWIVITGGKYSGLASAHKKITLTKGIRTNQYGTASITCQKISDKPYKGNQAVTLEEEDVVLVDPDYRNAQLKLGVDYEIAGYENNTREGTARVQFRGIGKYTGTRWEEFQIVAARLDSTMVKINGTYTYDIDSNGDGKDQFEDVKKNLVVSNGDVTYEEGVDYTVSRVPGDAGTSAGQHKITVSSTGKGMLRAGDSVTVTYNVEPRSLTSSGMSLRIVNYTNDIYDGRQKTPGLEITYTSASGGTKTLVAGTDYVTPLNYTNNINASKEAAVKATGKGNFGGESDWCYFEIKPIELIDREVDPNGNATIGGIANPAEYVYTGSEIQPNVKVTHTTRGDLNKGTDYTVSYENNTNVGITGAAKIKITGTGNYRGEFERSFTIIQRDLNDTSINIQVPPSVQYTGAQLQPAVTVRHSGRELAEDTDYTLSYGENIQRGTGSVTVTGIGNYKGTVEKPFAITPRNITSGTLNVRDMSQVPEYDFAVGTPDDRKYPYTGQDIKPALTVSYTNAEAGMNNVPLDEGKDYELKFSRNREIGTATVTIKAMDNGNYTGSKQVTFTIKGDLSNSTFTEVDIPEQVYTSNPIVPINATVMFDGKKLEYGKDYEVLCENGGNTNAGTATATIEGKGNYYSKAENVPFSIRKFDLSKDDLEEKEYVIGNIEESYPFCEVGHQLQPQPQITHNGNPLTKDTDYFVEYGDNDEVGKGTLTIIGDESNYTGSRQKEFQIVPYDLGADYAEGYVDVQGISDVILDTVIAGADGNAQMTDDGQVVMSGLKVMYTPVDLDGTELAARELDLDNEYEVSYRDNKKIGTATITINGKGNFGGTITRTFKIRGDLSSTRTKVDVEDCEYTPAGNTPEPTVTYTYDNGTTETLVRDVDYKVEYGNNTNATIKSGAKARATILPVMSDDGLTVEGNYAQSGADPRTAEFEILQRDLTNAIAKDDSEGYPEENPLDPSLKVTGLNRDGYEYNGLDIIPELQISCDEIGLSAGDDGDYSISAENNRDVYTFAETESGERGERLYPTVIVSAAHDEDGNYTGNYKGGFTLKFQINPRQISEETLSTMLRVEGIEYDDTQVPEVDYEVNKRITFPLDPDDPQNNRNDMTVTWSRDGQNTSLVENQDYSVSYKDNMKIGEAKIIISHVEFSNYEGTYERTFKIMASIEVVGKTEPETNPSQRYMSLRFDRDTKDHDVPFGIVPVYPDMVFEDYSGVLCGDTNEAKILEEGVDFEIVTEANPDSVLGFSKNNINVARENEENEEDRPLVVIRGIGCYRGVIARYYNIIPKNLSTDQGDITATFTNRDQSVEGYEVAYVYTGEDIVPIIEVRNHGQLMVPNVDYTVSGYTNNREICADKDNPRAGVTIRAVDGSNYEGQKTFYFNIVPRQITGMQVNLIGGTQVYNRKAKTPDVEVIDSEGKALEKGKDYDVAYENNVNAATEYAGDNAPVVIITGKGSYGGTLRKTFTIEPESLEPLEGEEDDFDITTTSAPYTGEEATTTLIVKAKDGTLLINKSDIPDVPEIPDNPDETEVPVTPDYEIIGYRDNVNAPIGYVTIRGLGNYTGTRDVPFDIIAPDVSEAFRIADIPDETYTGNPIQPEPRVWVEMDGREIQLAPSDYAFDYEDNTDAGTATLIVRGTGNYGGEVRKTFTITPKSIGTIENGIASDMTLEDIEDQLYTGRGVTPDVSLRLRRPAVVQEDEEDTDGLLVQGKDYTLSYLTNVPVGTASVTITGIGNYTGSISTQFRILGPMNLADVPKINAQPYTGSEVTPKPVVSLAGKLLTEDEDYTLAYANNVAQGTATITITGKGWYTGEKAVTFEIARDFSSETVVRGMAAAYTYTGKAITPAVLVEDHGRILSKGTDYSVSYSNNINVGTATVTVSGMGAYSGTASAQFKITPQNIGRATVSKVADQTYNKKSKKPSVSVSSGGVSLKNGTDYTVLHVDNKNPGKASVVIKGKGNFTGTQTVNYSIVVPKVTGVKVSSYTNTSITFSWKQNKVVNGYEIYNSKNKRVARVTKNSTVKATVSKLKAGSTGTFKVRAYVIRGQYYYSDFVSIKASTAPKATSITSLTSNKPKQVTIKWKKIKGATQYQVYRSTSINGKYKKIGTTKKTSYTDKKATNGKTYCYKIRVCKKVGSKTYYSYSAVKYIAAKK